MTSLKEWWQDAVTDPAPLRHFLKGLILGGSVIPTPGSPDRAAWDAARERSRIEQQERDSRESYTLY